MNLTDLASAYSGLRAAHRLPPMEVRHLRRMPQPLSDPTNPWAAFAALAPQAGWLQFQSQVHCFEQGQLPPPDDESGCLLAAEAVDTQGRSLLLRQDGRGGFLLVVISDGPGEGATAMLADEVLLLGTGRAPGRLRYRRYWQADDAQGITPVCAAFIGFAPV